MADKEPFKWRVRAQRFFKNSIGWTIAVAWTIAVLIGSGIARIIDRAKRR